MLFAPAEKPTIAIATVVEYGGHGGVTATPGARAVMEVYFRKKGMLKEPEKPKNAQGQSRAQPAVTTGADSSQERDSHA